ncbi:MAG: HPr(Ser) kinase/phosphatase [Ruminococcaceae bacterium]|nr:HPr(Ser) kinase/phosphatase [Oscillospiraceae bacterium]
MAEEKFRVSLIDVMNEFNLKLVNKVSDMRGRYIVSNEINRPSLQIAGYFDYFDNRRVQIVGRVEISYLERMTHEKRVRMLDRLFKTGLPCIIITRNLRVPQEMVELANEYDTPLFRIEMTTSRFMSALISYLNICLAPRITRHGVLVEVYGEGVLLLGDSGVGKSETAIELVKRGHRLVADDAVEIKRVSDKSLVGSAPEIIRHFIELRGIGIIDVKRIFGMGAVKDTEKIDMIIHLELWQDGKQYDRLGLSTEYTDILGLQIPSLTVPVKPGRNLAIIVEIAAMNNRQKRMGYNAAEALNNRLMAEMQENELEEE